MAQDRRKPPGRLGRLSWNVSAGGRDVPRDSPSGLRKQASTPGLVPIGPIAAVVVADLRFQRQVERVHALGPRAVAELLAEIGAERGITTIIDRKLDTYAGLDAAAIEAAGADRFPPAPFPEIGEKP